METRKYPRRSYFWGIFKTSRKRAWEVVSGALISLTIGVVGYFKGDAMISTVLPVVVFVALLIVFVLEHAYQLDKEKSERPVAHHLWWDNGYVNPP
jgi:hypothetical protein